MNGPQVAQVKPPTKEGIAQGDAGHEGGSDYARRR
jgi:hypothetical protein